MKKRKKIKQTDPIFQRIREVKTLLRLSKVSHYLKQISKIKQELPGRPVSYSNQSLILLYLVMRHKDFRSFRAFHTYLLEHKDIAQACGLEIIPCRHTLMRRMVQMYSIFVRLIVLIGRYFIQQNYCNAKEVGVDLKAFLCKQNKTRKPKRNKYNEQYTYFHTSKGLIWGVGLTAVITTTKNSIAFPILAQTHTAKRSTQKIFENMIYNLPEQTLRVLADSEYESSKVLRKIEKYDERGYLTRRAIIAPRDIKKMVDPLRKRNMAYFNSSRGQKKFDRRFPKVEGFFSGMINHFNLRVLPKFYKKLALSFLLFFVFFYQSLVWTNIMQNSKHPCAVKHLITH